MSDPLVWECIKKGNSFIRKFGDTPKRGGVSVFSAEKSNLASLNSYKFSGLANSRSIEISTAESEHATSKNGLQPRVKLTLKLKV